MRVASAFKSRVFLRCNLRHLFDVTLDAPKMYVYVTSSALDPSLAPPSPLAAYSSLPECEERKVIKK